jgi:hypothetical protein
MNMHKSDKNTNIDQKPLLCEYAVMPFADCFCLNISGSSIPKIAKYCMEQNSGCPIYERRRSENTTKQVNINA